MDKIVEAFLDPESKTVLPGELYGSLNVNGDQFLVNVLKLLKENPTLNSGQLFTLLKSEILWVLTEKPSFREQEQFFKNFLTVENIHEFFHYVSVRGHVPDALMSSPVIQSLPVVLLSEAMRACHYSGGLLSVKNMWEKCTDILSLEEKQILVTLLQDKTQVFSDHYDTVQNPYQVSHQLKAHREFVVRELIKTCQNIKTLSLVNF